MTKEKKGINFNKTVIQEGILLQRGARKKKKKKKDKLLCFSVVNLCRQ